MNFAKFTNLQLYDRIQNRYHVWNMDHLKYAWSVQTANIQYQRISWYTHGQDKIHIYHTHQDHTCQMPKVHKLYIQNSCHKDIQVAVRYLYPDTKEWKRECWYQINSNNSAYLATAGRQIEMENNVWYTYAKSVDRTLVWKGSGLDACTRTCKGQRLKMKRQTYVQNHGDLYVSFSCHPHHVLKGSDASSHTREMFPNDKSGSQGKVLKANKMALALQEVDFKYEQLFYVNLFCAPEVDSPSCNSSDEMIPFIPLAPTWSSWTRWNHLSLLLKALIILEQIISIGSAWFCSPSQLWFCFKSYKGQVWVTKMCAICSVLFLEWWHTGFNRDMLLGWAV